MLLKITIKQSKPKKLYHKCKKATRFEWKKRGRYKNVLLKITIERKY